MECFSMPATCFTWRLWQAPRRLGLGDETGDFRAGKSADLVYLRPPADSPLAAVLEREQSPEQVLAAIFTLAGAESVREVRVEGSVVYPAAPRRSDDDRAS